jgi:hypothetical protein
MAAGNGREDCDAVSQRFREDVAGAAALPVVDTARRGGGEIFFDDLRMNSIVYSGLSRNA